MFTPNMHMVAVPAGRDPQHVRRFGAYTADLHALADWLQACAITTVAMESTGVYWIPLFELLESHGFEVFLVEPGQLSHCGARPKTDVLDAQWIQRLHACGLLRGSFRPPDAVLALRGYHASGRCWCGTRPGTCSMQKALEQMNVKLTEVVWDLVARAYAKDAHENYFSSRRGIWHLEDLNVLCVYNNNPYADRPERREEETAAFRTWLRANGIRELAYATYPATGKEAGYTFAMLLDAGDDREDEVVAELHRILAESWARK